MKAEVIVPAAGFGIRMGGVFPKPLILIARKALLVHTLGVFEKNKSIKKIIIAANKENIDFFKTALKKFRIIKRFELVLGGKTRKCSVRNCLRRLSSDTELVIIHDAVRPFIDGRLVNALMKEAYKSGAAVCGVPVKATLKTLNSKFEVNSTLKRDNIWEIQTPQVFRKDLILKAYNRYGRLSVTDDSSLVEKLGIRVKVIKGSYFNIKITTPEDIIFAKAIFKARLR